MACAVFIIQSQVIALKVNDISSYDSLILSQVITLKVKDIPSYNSFGCLKFAVKKVCIYVTQILVKFLIRNEQQYGRIVHHATFAHTELLTISPT